MSFDDLLADRQANARTLVLRASVEPMGRQEDALRVLVVEADADVLHENLGLSERATQRVDLHHWRLARFLELECVADEILKDLTNLHGVTFDARQLPDVHGAAGRLD